MIRRALDPAMLRFALVGSVNTAIDLGLFLLLQAAGVPLLAANFVSTSGGLAFSFAANRSFTFRSSGGLRRQALTFVLGTGVGLWAVQPVVIAGVSGLLAAGSLSGASAAVLPKLAGIAVGMVWNWLLYSRWVFRAPVAAAPPVLAD